jgi:hypothetical protein
MVCADNIHSGAGYWTALLRARGVDALAYDRAPPPGGARGPRNQYHNRARRPWTAVVQASSVEALDLPHWPRLPDRMTVYRRNPARRPLRERDRCHEYGRFIRTASIGRCDWCIQRNPPAVAIQVGEHRVEYSAETLETVPPALRRAIEASRHRIR